MRKLFNKKQASIGIGAMIVFIAMVLVAGIAASVLIQTSTTLESQAMATGRETTDEVAGGIAVFDVEGHVPTGEDIDGLAITVRTRAGSPDIDLNESVILLTDGSTKTLLYYDCTDSEFFNSSVGSDDGDVFNFNYTYLSSETFGILVLSDPDDSLSRYNPVINRGDKVMLMVDTDAIFSQIGERTDVIGYVYPEHGSPGVISFRTPASYSDNVYDLQ